MSLSQPVANILHLCIYRLKQLPLKQIWTSLLFYFLAEPYHFCFRGLNHNIIVSWKPPKPGRPGVGSVVEGYWARKVYDGQEDPQINVTLWNVYIEQCSCEAAIVVRRTVLANHPPYRQPQGIWAKVRGRPWVEYIYIYTFIYIYIYYILYTQYIRTYSKRI